MGGPSAGNGWWSPERDRGVFFGFFVVGVFFILVLKTAVGNQLVATAVPCLFMLGYAVLQWDFDAREPKPDANGDNLYYLGFLYTLTSLGHALYRFSTEQEDTEAIVTNFGIAISTTILGMALRILLSRPDFDGQHAVDASARRDLASAGRRLRAELEYAADDFGGFRSELAKDFKVFRERLAQDADSAHAVVAKTLERALGLERAFESFEQATRKAVETIVDRTRELERSAAALTAFEHAVDRLDARTKAAVEAVGEHSTALAAGAAKIGESLRSQADGMRAVHETCAASLTQGADQLEAGAGAVRKSLQLQAERIGALDVPKAFNDAVQPASTELRAAAAEFRKLLDELRQTDASRERVAAGNERALAALNEVLRVQEDLSAAVAAAADGSRGAAESLLTAGDRLSGFNEGAEAAARRLVGVCEELARSAERLQVVAEELARTSATLASRVGAAGKDRPSRRWWWPFRWGR